LLESVNNIWEEKPIIYQEGREVKPKQVVVATLSVQLCCETTYITINVASPGG
jgi:hypothetical protein